MRPGERVGVSASGGNAGADGSTQVSSVQPQRAVPHAFELTALSPTFHDTTFGLGRVACDTGECPALIRSTQNGRVWRMIHVFDHTDTSAADDDAEPTVQPPGALSGLTFVSARVGYVFGGDLWMTTDGGRTFARIPHPDVSVLDVVARGQSVSVLTAAGCVQGSCSGRLEVTQAEVGVRGALPQPQAGVTPSAPVYAATLAGTGSDLVVFTRGATSSSGDSPGAWRLAGASLSALPIRSLCHGNSMLAAASASGSVTAACDASPAASTTSYSVLRSANGGKSWVMLGAGNLSLPTEGRLSLAGTDRTHLVAATGGPRLAPDGTNRVDTRIALAVSSDGGRSWHTPKTPSQQPPGGFDSVIASGVHTFVALPRHGGRFWRSTDDGQSWQEATVSAASD